MPKPPPPKPTKPAEPAGFGAFVTCPICGIMGHIVPQATLFSLIKPEAQHRIAAGPYHFCHAPHCGVVYYAADGSHIFTPADLTVKVGVKVFESPRPICYCFGHTAEEIAAEVQQTGSSQVLADIRSRMAQAGCDCMHTNPQGSCCLGAVLACVNAAIQRYGQGKKLFPSTAMSSDDGSG